MTTTELWHGSHTRGLKTILPVKGGLSRVYASSSIVVAALFTAYPRKFSFLVDETHSRVFIPGAEELKANNNGGSIYRVSGKFTPASDRLIYEFEAPRADVLDEKEIDSAVAFIISLGFQIYADSAIHSLAYFYQQAHGGQYPAQLPEQAFPLST